MLDAVKGSTFATGTDSLKQLSNDLKTYLYKTGGSALPSSKSLYDVLRGSPNMVYRTFPELSGAVTVTSGGSGWTYGSWGEIVAANAITEKFWLVGILMRGVAAGWYQVDVGKGASPNEARIATAIHRVDSAVGYILPYPFPIPIEIPANTRLAVRAASDGASNDIGTYVIVTTGALT